MSVRSFCIAILSLLTGGAALAGPAQWEFTLRSDRHGEVLPLRAFGGDDAVHMLDPRPGRNIAYADDEARLSRVDGQWRWSVLARGHATVVGSRDSFDLARQVSSRNLPAGDRRWETRLRYRGFSGAGLELERAFEPATHWRTRVSAQALALRHWRERRLDGPVEFDAASGTYSFDLHSTHADDRLAFPFQVPYPARGVGLLLGGAVEWHAKPWRLALSLRDAGWLHWRALPQQNLVLSTQTRSFDAEGFVIYKPLINGRNSQSGRTVRMPGRWQLAAGWQLDERTDVELSGDRVDGFGVLPAVGAQRRFDEITLGLAWRVHERRATVSMGWQHWQLRFGTDRLDGDARSRELSFVGRFPL